MLKSLGNILFLYASKYVNYAFNMFPMILVLCLSMPFRAT